ncbi:MAG: sulfotransferase [Planctomycetota bacterium]
MANVPDKRGPGLAGKAGQAGGSKGGPPPGGLPGGFGTFGGGGGGNPFAPSTGAARAPGQRGPQMTEKRQAAINEARKHIGEKELDEAKKILDPMTKGMRQDPEALFLMGIIAERQMNIIGAREFAKRSLKLFDHPDARLMLARVERIGGETDAAIDACDKVLAVRPGLEPALVIKGGALEEGGRFDEARELIEPLVKQYKDKDVGAPPPVRFEWSKLLVHEKNYEDAITEIDAMLEASPDDNLKRVALHLKAKACDRSKRYADAVESAKGANAIGELEFSPELYGEQVTTLMDNWSGDAMQKFPLAKCDSELPVFVAGMPRSGTSLIDQIIDAHPKAAGVGELSFIEHFAKQLSVAYDSTKGPPECFGRFNEFQWTKTAKDYVRDLQKRAPQGAERVVNKALGNNKLVGLIARLFPKTRIIHAIRDPRDVAVSCFMGGFNHAVHPWTTRFEWIFPAWEQSRRMMEHWKQTLDVPILDVHYEELVRDPGTQFPRIIEFLGLEWDDACNEYYKTKRTVRTLSYDQVNRPIYTTSAGRHANYLEFMGDVEFPAYP